MLPYRGAASAQSRETYSPPRLERKPLTWDEDIVSLSPNPTKDKIYLNSHGQFISLVKIIDGSSRMVFETNSIRPKNVASLEVGFYIIKFYNHNDVIGTKSFIKMQ